MGFFSKKRAPQAQAQAQAQAQPPPSYSPRPQGQPARRNEQCSSPPAPHSSSPPAPHSSSPPAPHSSSPPAPHTPPHHGMLQHNQSPFQPAGYLPAPPPAPTDWRDARPYPPIIVNQHYYLSPALPHSHANNPYQSSNGCASLSKLKLASAVDLVQLPGNVVNHILDDGLPRWHSQATQLLNQGAALYDQIWNKFDDVMTLIDRDRFAGNENALFMYQEPTPTPPQPAPKEQAARAPVSAKGRNKKNKRDAPKGQTSAVASTLISGGYFAKVELYANSKLPLNLPPLRLYMSTYPLLCLAAQYSERVYEKARGAERDAHVDADWRAGTKAMCLKSVPMDHMNTIVFAIRGTATFMDWAVNLNTAPTAPIGFLDDQRNFCHSGFLSVARKMIAPVAARLRQLLEENPSRCSYSLLITGHSAGGAIASLLYMHMLATSQAASSELNTLTGCFKRVHCITFGTPPVSLRPLETPRRYNLRKSLFLSFVNEGDPVVRADKAYVKSLLELFVAPAPGREQRGETPKLPAPNGRSDWPPKPHEKKSKASLVSKTSKMSMNTQQSSSKLNGKAKPVGPIWTVPPNTLSNAGRIVVLRSGDPHAKPRRTKTVEERLNEGVVAQTASEEQLRGLIWGDPVCHVMKLYAGRIEVLAVGAVTAQGRG
ncbi:alpha/beta-hydrolase [Xylariaceae sp. FL0016]|nr:alpha/beta-hydrolase [Xylariaceae sp. FL0016]